MSLVSSCSRLYPFRDLQARLSSLRSLNIVGFIRPHNYSMCWYYAAHQDYTMSIFHEARIIWYKRMYWALTVYDGVNLWKLWKWLIPHTKLLEIISYANVGKLGTNSCVVGMLLRSFLLSLSLLPLLLSSFYYYYYCYHYHHRHY